MFDAFPQHPRRPEHRLNAWKLLRHRGERTGQAARRQHPHIVRPPRRRPQENAADQQNNPHHPSHLDPPPSRRYIPATIAAKTRPMSTTEQTRPATGQLRHARMLIDGAGRGRQCIRRNANVENPGRRMPVATIPRGNTEDVPGRRGGPEDVPRLEQNSAPPARPDAAADRRGHGSPDRGTRPRHRRGDRQRAPYPGATEATLTADIFRYFGGLAGELKGETIPLGKMSSVIHAASRWASWAPSFPGTPRCCWAR